MREHRVATSDAVCPPDMRQVESLRVGAHVSGLDVRRDQERVRECPSTHSIGRDGVRIAGGDA